MPNAIRNRAFSIGYDAHSYAYYMRENLFGKTDIDPRNTHLPLGTAPDLAAECERYTARRHKPRVHAERRATRGKPERSVGVGGDDARQNNRRCGAAQSCRARQSHTQRLTQARRARACPLSD